MGKDELRSRTKQFALDIIKLTEELPNTPAGRAVSNQIVRSGSGVGSNYRSAKRARSTADFINKMSIVEEETDETMYWLEIIVEAGLMTQEKITDLYNEGDEILAMTVASINTAKSKE